jgi:uncharacterized protein (DUF488 family)
MNLRRPLLVAYAAARKEFHYPRTRLTAEAKFSASDGIPGSMMKEMRAKPQEGNSQSTIFTIGHSTRPIGDFLQLLQSNGIGQIIDIRTIPKSRFNPHFSGEALEASLKANGMQYVHVKELGGLRRPRSDSQNLGWRNAGFRGYADYMQTPEFKAAIERAIRLATSKRSALMCAEVLPWRCHRSLVADALAVRGIRVQDIVSSAQPKEHKLMSFARVQGMAITYPKEEVDNPG